MNNCPNCSSGRLKPFHEVRQVPVHSVLQVLTCEIGSQFPRRDILLGFCGSCGFISNISFDPTVHSYSADYEETQSYSPTFRSFHARLCSSLIEKYNLRGKDIIEIGCGKGDFLSLLCEMGGNRGTGFDPAFVRERNPAPDAGIRFVSDFYSEKYTDCQADFICCKMTLEHIPNTAEFVRTVRRSIGDRRDTTVFFQVPDVRRVLRDVAFWDIYYEHCSYFSAGSLARLFAGAGFDVLDAGTDYDDQYLMVAARPVDGPGRILPEVESVEALAADVERFREAYKQRVPRWTRALRAMDAENLKVVIWGAGSKGVAFLSLLGDACRIEYCVDINPHRQGMYMAGTAQRIVGPEFLKTYRPDIAVAMNAIYLGEIQGELDKLELPTRLIASDDLEKYDGEEHGNRSSVPGLRIAARQ